MKPTIINFNLSIAGLVITYANGAENTTTLKYDAKATADLFVNVGINEGMDIDANGEPVIYYTENIYGRKAPAYCLWCDFVKSFPFNQRYAEIIVEYLLDTRATRKALAKINYLLQPLKATA